MENIGMQKNQKQVIYSEKSVKVSLFEKNMPNTLIFKPHCHQRLELLRVVSGELIVTLNQKSIIAKKDSLVVINPYNMHTGISGSNGVTCYAIMFDLDKLFNESTLTQKYLMPLLEQILILENYVKDEEIIKEVDRLIEFSKNDSMCAIGSVYMLLGLFLTTTDSLLILKFHQTSNFTPLLTT